MLTPEVTIVTKWQLDVCFDTVDKLKTNNDAGIGFPQEMIGNESLGPR